MSLEARIAKLERTHTRVLRCPWCRFSLCSQSPSANNSPVEPPDVLQTKCWSCGTKFVIPIRGLNQYQREVADLIHNSHPTRQFIDERIYAANVWSLLYRSEVKAYEKEKQTDTFQKPSTLWREEKAKRDQERLQQQAIEFWSTQHERFKRLAKGPESFPIDHRFEEIDREYPSSGYNAKTDQLIERLGLEKYSQESSRLRSTIALCNGHLQTLKKREACEEVIWSETLPETAQEIAFFDLEKQHAIRGRVNGEHKGRIESAN